MGVVQAFSSANWLSCSRDGEETVSAKNIRKAADPIARCTCRVEDHPKPKMIPRGRVNLLNPPQSGLRAKKYWSRCVRKPVTSSLKSSKFCFIKPALLVGGGNGGWKVTVLIQSVALLRSGSVGFFYKGLYRTYFGPSPLLCQSNR